MRPGTKEYGEKQGDEIGKDLIDLHMFKYTSLYSVPLHRSSSAGSRSLLRLLLNRKFFGSIVQKYCNPLPVFCSSGLCSLRRLTKRYKATRRNSFDKDVFEFIRKSQRQKIHNNLQFIIDIIQ